jgi:ABC-type antimicrobial peptide transport system permease subunit
MEIPAWRKSTSVAMHALARNKLQTILTMVGMTIGVATVLTMIALGSAAETSIQDQVRAAGMNVILVTSGNYRMQQQWTDEGGGEEPTAYAPAESHATLRRLNFDPDHSPLRLRRIQTVTNPTHALEEGGDNEAGRGAAETLTLDDAAGVQKLSGVQYVSPDLADNVAVHSDTATWVTRMHGAGVELPYIRRSWVLRYGKFFTKSDVEKSSDVIVLGNIVSKKLFGTDDPVGKTVEIGGRTLKVIGVVGSSSWMVPEQESDDQFDAMYVPVTTGEAMLGHTWLDGMTVSTASTGDVTRVIKSITAYLRQQHHIPSSEASDFTVSTQARKSIAKGGMRTDVARAVVGNMDNLDKVTLDQLGKSLDRASKTMTALLASIATVSLVVGGIGIMNIMMLSVTQRTKEIGIRRAVGARSHEIMMQFLMEAIVLSVGGGGMGIVLGFLASNSITQLIRWSTHVSPAAVILSFGISAVIGIAFGYYPARKASLVSPMTSLRYE